MNNRLTYLILLGSIFTLHGCAATNSFFGNNTKKGPDWPWLESESGAYCESTKNSENKNSENQNIAKQNIEKAKQNIETAKQNLGTTKQNLETVKQNLETAKQNLETAKPFACTKKDALDSYLKASNYCVGIYDQYRSDISSVSGLKGGVGVIGSLFGIAGSSASGGASKFLSGFSGATNAFQVSATEMFANTATVGSLTSIQELVGKYNTAILKNIDTDNFDAAVFNSVKLAGECKFASSVVQTKMVNSVVSPTHDYSPAAAVPAAAEKPAAEKPAAEKPAAEKPAAEKKAAEKKAAEKPEAKETIPEVKPNTGLLHQSQLPN